MRKYRLVSKSSPSCQSVTPVAQPRCAVAFLVRRSRLTATAKDARDYLGAPWPQCQVDHAEGCRLRELEQNLCVIAVSTFRARAVYIARTWSRNKSHKVGPHSMSRQTSTSSLGCAAWTSAACSLRDSSWSAKSTRVSLEKVLSNDCSKRRSEVVRSAAQDTGYARKYLAAAVLVVQRPEGVLQRSQEARRHVERVCA